MPRVYLDTNVFSNLRANTHGKFQELNNTIKSRLYGLSIFFSVAHIRDKRKDLTDLKFLDFRFMEGLVSDNHISYNAQNKKTSFYLETPLMVFNDDFPKDEYSFLTDFLEPAEEDDNFVASIKHAIKSLFNNLPAPFNFVDLSNIPEDQKEIIKEFFPSEGSSMMDQMKNMLSFSERLHTDNILYKDLRNLIDEGVNKGTISLDDEIDFNEALADTTIQKSFLDFVKSCLYKKDNEPISFYDLFQMSYSMLDMLGISKDKITKKNTLANLQNDGMHSYYSSYCDYFVTDDKITRSKSMALFKLFNITTKVLTTDEFDTVLTRYLNDFQDTEVIFWKKFLFNFLNTERLSAVNQNGKIFNKLIESHYYLGFFDSIYEIKDEAIYQFIIFKGFTNPISGPSYSEQAKIINNAIAIFGDDVEKKMNFDYKEKEVKKDSDFFRFWIKGDIKIELTYAELISNAYSLILTMPLATAEIIKRNSINLI